MKTLIKENLNAKKEIFSYLDFRSKNFKQSSHEMYELIKILFPLNRSITGSGFRQSLEILKKAYGGGI